MIGQNYWVFVVVVVVVVVVYHITPALFPRKSVEEENLFQVCLFPELESASTASEPGNMASICESSHS